MLLLDAHIALVHPDAFAGRERARATPLFLSSVGSLVLPGTLRLIACTLPLVETAAWHLRRVRLLLARVVGLLLLPSE